MEPDNVLYILTFLDIRDHFRFYRIVYAKSALLDTFGSLQMLSSLLSVHVATDTLSVPALSGFYFTAQPSGNLEVSFKVTLPPSLRHS